MNTLKEKGGVFLAIGLLAASLVAQLSSLVAGSASAPRAYFGMRRTKNITEIHRYQLLLPFKDLIACSKVSVAVVVPMEREQTVAVQAPGLIAMRGFEKRRVDNLRRGYGVSEYPFTPVKVRAVEVLKGELPKEFEVWEERGKVNGIKVDSDDPILPIGVKGLLVVGKYDNGVFAPLIFAPISGNGYIPDLRTSVMHLREMLVKPRETGHK